mgnify:CR=1 FL=1|tara:strand:+ start:198 stop:2672 length:2475 start_codon:yes stop_codon:yes gene_type:complete
MVQIVAPVDLIKTNENITPNITNPEYFKQAEQKFDVDTKAKNDEATRFLQGDFQAGEDLTDAWFKFTLAKNKTLTAKQQNFSDKYPNGVLTQITLPSTKETKLIYKKTPQDKFRFLDIGINAPEIMGALASGETIGGTIGSFFTPAGTVAGTAIGSLAETGLQKALGYDVPSLSSELKEAGKEGVIAGSFDVATRGALKFFKSLYKGGLKSTLDTATFSDDISQFASDELLEPLAIGQVAKRPVVGSIYSQVGGTSKIPQDLTVAQVKSLKNNFGKISDSFNPANFSEEQLSIILKSQQDDLLNQTVKNFNRNTLSESFERSGTALSEGIENWKNASRVKRNTLYDKAINSSDDFSFDLTDFQQTAKNVDRQIKMLQKQAYQDQVVGTQLIEGVEAPIMKSSKLPKKYKNVADIPEAIKKEITLIQSLDPSVSKIQYKGQNFQPFEQMKALRTRLYYLQQEKGNTGRLANELFNSLKQVMDNPLTGSDEALQLYKDASKYNLYREKTLKIPVIAKGLKTQTPEDFVKTNFSNTQPSEIKVIKKLVSPEKFDTLKNAYVYQMLNDTPTLNKFVRNLELNKDTTNLIFNKDQISALQKYQSSISKLDKSKLSQAVAQDVSDFDRMVLLSNEGTETLKNIIQKQGGKDSKFAQSLRAGAFKKILDDATTQDAVGGVEYLDTKKVYAGLNKLYQNKNLMEFVFNKADLKKLENFGLYTILIKPSVDVGGQIQVGELASKLASPLRPIQAVGAVVKIKQNDFIAKILSQPYKASSQKAYKQSNFLNPNRLKELSIMINSTAQQLDDDRKKTILMNPNISNIRPVNAIKE